jgi:hypothetical protein
MKKITIKTPGHKKEAIDIISKIPLGGSWEIAFRETSKRSLDQNNLLWAMLGDISNQIKWHGIKMTPESWKDLFTAGLKRSMVIPNLENDGFVVVGLHTSTMTIKEMSELIELMTAFATEHNVKFSATDDFIKANHE